MTQCLHKAVERAACDFLTKRSLNAHVPGGMIDPNTPIFSTGLLDSMSLTEMVLHVEKECDQEIDFLMIDPNGIETLSSLVDALTDAVMVECNA